MTSSLIRAEIDLNAIAHNTKTLRSIALPNARFMAVVKANGYGHGDIQVAQTALENGADSIGVARSDEGKRLRNAGISAPILVFGYIPPENIQDLIAYDLTSTVYSCDTAAILSEKAVSEGHPIRVHVKVDTGMGRIGFLPDQLRCAGGDNDQFTSIVGDVLSIANLPGIVIEGVYTHFATTDFQKEGFARNQLNLFLAVVDCVEQKGVAPSIKHAANSGALLSMPESHLDMVRSGIALYGLQPPVPDTSVSVDLKPAMSLKTSVVHVKQVPENFTISYGCTYHTDRPTTIATVPVGYADGFNRLLSCGGQMLVNGQKAPVVGRVCMDLTMLDVGHIPNVKLGDEVVVFGEQSGTAIRVDDLADTLDTINYEIVTSISERVPRVYV